MAIGAGVLVGCTPFFGFHLILGLVTAFVFRLNVVYVLLGTQISNPFFATFLAVLSVAIGRSIVNSSNTLGGFSFDWLVGSLLLGGALGVVSGFVSYHIAKRLSRHQTTP